MIHITFLRTFWIAGIFIAFAAGEKCQDGNGDFLNLPSVIGLAGADSNAAFPLRCDTVYVPKGSKTVVNAGTLLYFNHRNPVNLIRVEGTLILLGTKDHYVTLAGGARDNHKTGPEPSKSTWSGIEVEPQGKLEMTFTGVYGAVNPITVNSPDVKIVNSYFTGGKGIVRPDGSWYLLDTTFSAVNDLDFSKATEQASDSNSSNLPSKLNADERAQLLTDRSGGFWSSPLTWIALGGSAAAVSGYFIYEKLQPAKSTSVTPSMDPIPAVP